jgi:hypothetical protein
MKRLGFVLAVAVSFGACRTPEALILREHLKARQEWPVVRTAAQAALAKNEPVTLGWKAAMAPRDTGAIYPIKKDGEVWLVHACDDYPQNRYGVVVEMEISDAGELRSYTRLWTQKKEANQSLQPTAPSRRG